MTVFGFSWTTVTTKIIHILSTNPDLKFFYLFHLDLTHDKTHLYITVQKYFKSMTPY